MFLSLILHSIQTQVHQNEENKVPLSLYSACEYQEHVALAFMYNNPGPLNIGILSKMTWAKPSTYRRYICEIIEAVSISLVHNVGAIDLYLSCVCVEGGGISLNTNNSIKRN